MRYTFPYWILWFPSASRVERGEFVYQPRATAVNLLVACSGSSSGPRAQAQDLLPSFIHSHQVIKLSAHNFFSPISLCMIHAECDCQTIDYTFFVFSFVFSCFICFQNRLYS